MMRRKMKILEFQNTKTKTFKIHKKKIENYRTSKYQNKKSSKFTRRTKDNPSSPL